MINKTFRRSLVLPTMTPVKRIGSVSFFLLLFLRLVLTTNYTRLLTTIEIDTYEYPKSLNVEFVKTVVDSVDVGQIKDDLMGLIDALPSDRYYKSKNGLKAAQYLQKYLENLVKESKQDIFNVSIFKHHWIQPSLILRMNGKEEDTVIIGCHIDSINFKFYQEAPGVDDNLTGIVTVIQAIKLLIKLINNSQMELKNSVEFHFYSAEEVGVVGSTQVFEHYRKENAKIVAMLQQDMTGYTKKTIDSGEVEHFGLITDYASNSLMKFVKLLVEEYTSIPVLDTECGKICSDHVSALMFQYPSVYVLESKVELGNPFMHTEEDTIDKIDFNHMKEHVKLTTAFMIELVTHGLPRAYSPKDTVTFRYVDFLILVAMHQTKRFVYAVMSFAMLVASFYITYSDYRASLRKDDPAHSPPPEIYGDRDINMSLLKNKRSPRDRNKKL